MNERFRSRMPPVLWLILVVLAVFPARAQDAGRAVDAFTLAGVPVDVTAATAVEARTRAVAEGQRAAYQRLLRRMTPETEWSRLPPADGTTLDRLVRGFQVAEERTSATRYLAKLTVTFHREPVRRLLRDAGIAYTETASRPTLVLPVFRDASGLQLWETTNPWRAAWAERPERDTLAPLVLPSREDAAPDDLDPKAVIAGDEPQLRRLAARVGAGPIAVVDARAGSGGYDVTVTRYGAEGPQTSFASYPSLAVAAEKLAQEWDETWKSRTILRFDARGTLNVEVPYAGIEAWVAIRRKLGEVSEISRIEVASLTNQDARLVLSHIGDVETLKLALRQRDLLLSEAGDGWRIEPGRRSGGPGSR